MLGCLKYMVEQEKHPLSYDHSMVPRTIDRCFDLMSSRHPVTAFSRVKMEEYQRAITFLQEIIQLFRGMRVGQKG